MFPIEKSDFGIKVTFNRGFYDMFPLTEVCERFQKIAKLELIFIPSKNSIEIHLKPKVDLDERQLILEFCNHCLHEQITLSK